MAAVANCAGWPLLAEERDLELLRHRAGNLGLDREDVLQLPVVGFRPDIGAVARFDQRDRDPHPVGRLPHAPFEQVIDAKLFADGLTVLASCL